MRDSHRAGAAKAEGRNTRGKLAGPGRCPPEAYYVCYLPYYDRDVVTVSRDSTNPSGYRNLAIEPFEARLTLRYQCKRMVPPIPWEEENPRPCPCLNAGNQVESPQGDIIAKGTA